MANDGKAKGEISLEMLTLGKILGRERLARNITQKEMEAATGIAQPQLSGFENGKKGMPVESLAAIGRVLGVALRVPPEMTEVVEAVGLGHATPLHGRRIQAAEEADGSPAELLNVLSVYRSRLTRSEPGLESYLDGHPRLREDVRFMLRVAPHRTKHGTVKDTAFWDEQAKYWERELDARAAKRGAKSRTASRSK